MTEQIRAAIAQNPRGMTMQIARQLGVPEADVIAALPEGQRTELDASRWEDVVRALEPLGKVHVIVSNGAATLEVFGQFGGFSHFMGYFNVQTASLDMHLREGQISRVFAVEKPGHLDGVNTLSFQFYDARGNSAFKVFLTFGGKAPPAEKVEQFSAIRDRFSRRGAESAEEDAEKEA